MLGSEKNNTGFGTMLGSVKASPDSWTATISGLYLAADALSGIICMFSYKALFEQDGVGAQTGIRNFFCAMGAFIGMCGYITAFVYNSSWSEYKPPVTEEAKDVEQQALIKKQNQETPAGSFDGCVTLPTDREVVAPRDRVFPSGCLRGNVHCRG